MLLRTFICTIFRVPVVREQPVENLCSKEIGRISFLSNLIKLFVYFKNKYIYLAD